jgi:TonB family protein
MRNGTPVAAWLRQAVDWKLGPTDLARPGALIFRIFVDAGGKPGEIQLLRSSGDPSFDERAMNLVRTRLRYSPPTDAEGKPIAGWVTQGFRPDDAQVASATAARPATWIPDPESQLRRHDYPPESVRLGEEGAVILRVSVSETGAVVDVQLHRSSGYPRLDEAAINIVRRRFRYTPARDAQGKPVAAVIHQGVKWTLEDSDAPTRQPIPGSCRDEPVTTVDSEHSSRSRVTRRQLLIAEDGKIERILIVKRGRWVDVDRYTLQRLNREVRYFPPRWKREPAKCWIDADIAAR